MENYGVNTLLNRYLSLKPINSKPFLSLKKTKKTFVLESLFLPNFVFKQTLKK
jgi:hypothetical protein